MTVLVVTMAIKNYLLRCHFLWQEQNKSAYSLIGQNVGHAINFYSTNFVDNMVITHHISL